jgi:hypothetical protein
MKIVLVAGAVLAVLGTGGLTGAALTAAPERPPVADDSSQEPTDEPSDDVEDTDDEGDSDDSDEGSGKPDDEAKAAQHAAQRAFVAAKREWTACVGEAAPAHEPGAGPFDPEEACGPKPHPHDDDADDSEKPGASGGEREHGKPAWAGGPENRTAEPPGHAAHRQESKSH